MKKIIILALLRNMEIIFVMSLLALGFILSITVFDTDYNKLMKPIKAIKLEEQAEGKTPPVYDGVTEPNFPDENQNAKGLRGVDSNKDGVRDDIEIWINRKAEDRDVRMTLKELYRRYIISIKAANGNETLDQGIELEADRIEAGVCLTLIIDKYKDKYKHQKLGVYDYYMTSFRSMMFNTFKRERFMSAIDRFAVGKGFNHSNGIDKRGLDACSFEVERKFF